jgi:hypothetical protein
LPSLHPLIDHRVAVFAIHNGMIAALGYLHVLSPRQRALEIESRPPIPGGGLCRSPNAIALLAEPPVPGGFGRGLLDGAARRLGFRKIPSAGAGVSVPVGP